MPVPTIKPLAASNRMATSVSVPGSGMAAGNVPGGTPPAPGMVPPRGIAGGASGGTRSTRLAGAAPSLPQGVTPFMDMMNHAFGAGNPFNPYASMTPFSAASQAATQRSGELLDRGLANIRNQFGAAGVGQSDRSALAQGAATGEAASSLGTNLATLGLGAFGQDADRALSALGLNSSTTLGQQGLALEGLRQLFGQGSNLLALAMQENPSLMNMLLPLLQGGGATTGTSRGTYTGSQSDF